MNVAIVGCGLIGKKRANALGDNKLVAVADTDINRANSLASGKADVFVTANWKEAVRHKDVEIVIISTTNDQLAVIAYEAVSNGKHVLVEKPAGRNSKELEPIIAVAQKNVVKVKVGFNLRYHPALKKAKEIVDSGSVGPLMFIRARYGHGGRIGYDREWRADKQIAGGGELLDQGVHLVDLSRWFLGDFTSVEGYINTYFWDMPVEDNGFMNLRTETQQVAWLHASCTEWKNMFSFEIYGKHGKLQIDGLGGSYGLERLSYYKMLPEMGPPETTIWEYPGEDRSWKNEMDDFIQAIKTGEPLCGDIQDAHAALKIIDQIYGGSASDNH
jgi:predicted dehydrogenase